MRPLFLWLATCLTLSAAGHRIASFSPGATQTLIDLGCSPEIVMATRWCPLPKDHPAARDADVFLPDLERLLKTKPDLVILPRMANPLWAEKCAKAGLQTLVLIDLGKVHRRLVGVDPQRHVLHVVPDAFFAGDALRSLLFPCRSAQALGGLKIVGVHPQIRGHGLSAPGLAPLLQGLTQITFSATGLNGCGRLWGGFDRCNHCDRGRLARRGLCCAAHRRLAA